MDHLVELRAVNLGVIEEIGLVLSPGMTAITGETGAGKTLVLTAIQLLIGGRADAAMVGPHGDEAVVEGRFLHRGDEVVVQRVLPRDGRSRAYMNGRLATVASLADLGRQTVELHGQNGHQALAATVAQRAALDRFAGVDIAPLVEARVNIRAVLDELHNLGGDERERFRQAELLQFQVDEIAAAGLQDPNEDVSLQARERLLADAGALQEAAAAVSGLIGADSSADEALRQAMVATEGREALADLSAGLQSVLEQFADLASQARQLADGFEDDPAQLAQLQERRRTLSDLRRKYGDQLSDVMAYDKDVQARLQELRDHEVIAQRLQDELAGLEEAERAASAVIGAQRRAGAPKLAEAITEHVRDLALPHARIEIEVGEDPGDQVTMLVAMNQGMDPHPLAKVASGGELARVMLATRLVLSAEPATMIFDEVDAGVGGAAAQAVGSALSRLGENRQVLVVTHLPQVAACAHHQLQVHKEQVDGMVQVGADLLLGESRVTEISRMLSGSPDSATAREHAEELLKKSPGKIRVEARSARYGETP